MDTPTVGDRVWFRDRVWIVHDVCLESNPGVETPCGPPHVKLIDVEDESHQFTLLAADWRLLRHA